MKCELMMTCLLMVVACTGKAKSDEPSALAVADTVETVTAIPEELPLPEVPETLREPVARANYVVAHFWDSMDFGDTVRSHNADFIEQNFANYISLFPYAETNVLYDAVGKLLDAAATDSAAYILLAKTAEKYLYEPNSPMYSEEHYLPFLEKMADSPLLNKVRLQYQLEAVHKNRPGMTAADFTFLTRDGRKTSLRKTKTNGHLLLMFYDPDCDHCKEIMGDLQASGTLSAAIVSGRITVLAIYSGEDRELWKETAPSLPERWIVGMDTNDLEENGLYVLQAMPTLYLLDKDKKVVLKDVLPERLYDWIRQGK